MHSCLKNEKVVYHEGGLYEEQKETDNAREILNYGGHYLLLLLLHYKFMQFLFVDMMRKMQHY
jgi:hypothetical protein